MKLKYSRDGTETMKAVKSLCIALVYVLALLRDSIVATQGRKIITEVSMTI